MSKKRNQKPDRENLANYSELNVNQRQATSYVTKTILIIVACMLLTFVALFVVFNFLYPTSTMSDSASHALSSSTTYYKSGSSFFTLSSSVQHYKCTNSSHSGTNDYTTSSVSGTCYTWRQCDDCGDDWYDCSCVYYDDCDTCGGTGRISETCSICGGAGYYYEDSEDCPYCDGGSNYYSIHCEICGGDGIARCDGCNGNGWVTCPECGGEGDPCIPCEGSGSMTCWECNGSGTQDCSNNCDGGTISGYETCSYCDGAGEFEGDRVSCPKTTSSTCSDCSGSGEGDSYYSDYTTRSVSHSISLNYTQYTYKNIDTGGTTTSNSAYSTATGYTVSFNSNGGSGSMSSQYFLHSHSQALNANTFTRSNYKFKGWATSSTGSVTYSDKQTLSLSSGSSFTLYANWELQGVTVTLNNQSATTAGTTSVTAAYGSAMPSITVPTRNGYTFGGYYTSTGGSGTQYYTSSGASAKTCDLTSATTLYAKWTANTYSITVNLNGGSGSSSTTYTVSTSSQTKTISKPTKAGYTFSSWTVSCTGGYTPWISGTTLTIPANCYGAITLTATWTYNSYSVSVNLNGGGGTSDTTYIVSTSSQTLTIFEPARARYAFAGWTVSCSGGSPTISGTTLTIPANCYGDITLTANWIPAYVSTGELLTDPTTAMGSSPFDQDVLKTLINMIYGASGDERTQASALKSSTGSSPLSAADLRAKEYNKLSSQGIVVRLGGLDWLVTYVSSDTSGDLVVTLWLNGNHQEAWSGRNENLGDHYGLTNGGLYSDWADDWYSETVGTYPSNMYGTSYIRVETLNNPNNRTYATSETAITSGTAQSTSHIFSLYTCSSKGLTRYLDTPNMMSWINNLQDKSLIGSKYNCNNDSLATSGGIYYSDTYNYAGKTGYTNWSADYLWLPSLTETGYKNTYAGIWETDTVERMAYDGTTASFDSSTIGSAQSGYTGAAYVSSWSRSAQCEDSYRCYPLNWTGAAVDYVPVNRSQAVRPCLLLNLSKILETAIITLDQQGGSGGTSSLTATYGDTLPSITAPTRTGYTFNGYYTGTSGSGTKIYDASGAPAVSSSPFTGATTLYASWTGITYSVKYNANGGSGTMSDSTHTYGIAKSLTANSFTKTGYSFSGWATSSSGSVVYLNQASVTSLTSTAGGTYNLYAVWQPVAVTISLNNQSAATSGTTSVTATYDAVLPSITAPARTKYTFEGYFTSTNGGGTKIYNSDGTPAISKSTFTSATTLYAYWTAYREISVSANIDDAIGILTGAGSYAQGTQISLTAYPRVGYVLLYWTKDGAEFGGNAQNELTVTVSDDCTYEAVFATAGINLNAVVVTATTGGVVCLEGTNFDELGDSDLITVRTFAWSSDYEFVGWCLDIDLQNSLSTDTTFCTTKAQLNGRILVAVWRLK